MQRRFYLLFCAMIVAIFPPVLADDPVFSGPQVGETLAPFEVQIAVGPSAGEAINFVKQAEGKPLVLVFVHALTRPSAGLTRAIMSYAASLEKDGMQRGVVWLTEDASEAEQYITRARQSLQLNATIGISPDGLEGPGALGLNRNVTLTILVAKQNKVTANFALVQPGDTDLPAIGNAMAAAVGAEAPDPQELQALAYGGRGGGRGAAMRPNMQRQAPVDAKLRELLRDVAAEDLTETSLRETVQQISNHIGQDAAKRAELARLSTNLLDLGYGTEMAKPVLRRWAASNPDASARPQRPQAAPPSQRGQANAGPNDPQLTEMMRPLIQPGMTEERAEQIAAQVTKYIGDDPDKRTQFMRISGIVLEREYGTEIGRAQFQSLRKQFEQE